MLKTLLFLFSVFNLFSSQQMFGQEFNFSLFSPQTFVNPIGIEEIEPSAIESIENEDFLLVADDKNPALSVVSMKEGKKVGTVICETKIPNCDLFGKENHKWEAMARDGDDYYIIGAYRKSREYDNEKIFFRFKVNKVKASEFKITSIIRLEVENIFKDVPAGDLRVEGLAVRKTGNATELIIGIRNNDVNNKNVDETKREVFTLKLIAGKKNLNSYTTDHFFRFDPKHTRFYPELPQKDKFPFHLSSLEYVPQLKGFLIVTSTEDEGNNFFGNALWFMSDDKIAKKDFTPVKITENSDFEADMKAEGLCVISNSDNKYHLAIVFDNDKALKNGKSMESKLYFYDLSATLPVK